MINFPLETTSNILYTSSLLDNFLMFDRLYDKRILPEVLYQKVFIDILFQKLNLVWYKNLKPFEVYLQFPVTKQKPI